MATSQSKSTKATKEKATKKVVLATSKQTWALFCNTQVDVRNLKPALTVDHASSLISDLFEAKKRLTKVQFSKLIDEKVRPMLLKAGGVDKRKVKLAKQEEAEPKALVRRFDILEGLNEDAEPTIAVDSTVTS